MNWTAAVLVATLVLVAGGCSSDEETQTQRERKDISLWLERPNEPYPFTTPIPELEPTPVDGRYERRTSVRMAGGYPVACRRCSPYRIEAGISKLILEQGRFLVRHRPARPPKKCEDCKAAEGFTSVAHFFADDNRIELFNDANCPKERGVYELTIEENTMILEVVTDDCPFGELRARYLTDRPWMVRS